MTEKEKFLQVARDSIGNGYRGIAVDLCEAPPACENRSKKKCYGCMEAYRRLPGQDVEYFRQPIHEK